MHVRANRKTSQFGSSVIHAEIIMTHRGIIIIYKWPFNVSAETGESSFLSIKRYCSINVNAEIL